MEKEETRFCWQMATRNTQSVIASANTGRRPNQPSPRSEAIEGVDKLNNDCNVSVSSSKLANTPIALLREESSDPLTVFMLFDVRLLIKSLESAFICKHCQNENNIIRNETK